MEQNLPQYGVVHRIWRAIYPMLIYVVILIGVSAIYLAVTMFSEMAHMGAVGSDAAGVMYQIAAERLVENAMAVTFASQLVALAVFLPMWLKTRRKYPRWTTGGRMGIGAFALLVVFSFVMYFVISMIVGLLRASGLFDSYEAVEASLSGGSILLQVVAVGLCGPIVEELCFRGVIINRMSDSKLWIAIIVQAVLFGFAHMNLLQGLYAAMIGVFCGYLYTQYRTIWVPIIMHVVFNMTNVWLASMQSGAEVAEQVAEPAQSYGAVVIVILVAGAIGAACMAGLLKLRPAAKEGHTTADASYKTPRSFADSDDLW